MLRSSLTLAGLVALCAAASAQQVPTTSTRIQPITGTVRDAGTYHLATGTWTRKASQANLGADTIYDNTCSSGYFSALSTDTYVDEGRIPSPSGPSNLNARPGCNTQYTIDGFQIAYCTDQPSMGTYTVNFFQSYTTCSSVIGVTPTAGFGITGLPAAAGTAVCWIVTIDLDSPPQTASLAFNMLADGDGTYSGAVNTNLFGWSMGSSLLATAAATGPIIAGDFALCTGYDGTRWDPVVNYAEAGTGMSTSDTFRIEGGTTTAGCYFFGGIPFASFHLELYSDACGIPSVGTPFCFGDGTGTACPCANHSVVGAMEGCLSSISLTLGGKLRGTGVASISADTVTLLGTQMPNSSALYFQGTTQQAGGAGGVFGDGKRCAGGNTVRLKTVQNAAGASQYPQAGDASVSVKGLVTVPGTRTYQVWYRNAAAFCTAATFNLTNGLDISWGA